jgi:hypothetical protein
MVEFAELFQTAKKEGTLLALFIPSADREGNSFGKKEQKRWVRKALKLLGTRLRGATDAQRGRLVWDRPVLIQCFTSEEALEEHSEPVKQFLIELGTETNQGAVGFVIDRTYYEIAFPLKGN